VKKFTIISAYIMLPEAYSSHTH